MRSAAWGLLAMVPVLAVAAPAGAEDEAWNEFKGRVVVSDVMLARSFESDQLMIAALHRMECTQVSSTQGFWRLHLVAFLDRPAGSEVLRIVARDVTAAGGTRRARHVASALGGAARPVKVFEVEAQP